MATIINPQLSSERRSRGTSVMNIRYTVNWDENEQASRSEYQVDISLRGEDRVAPDDNVFAYSSSSRSNGRASQDFHYRFMIAPPLMNEKPDRNEIYTKIVITPRRISKTSGRTNVISGYF